jgi:predicted N-formylglutamate amidohydrolase
MSDPKQLHGHAPRNTGTSRTASRLLSPGDPAPAIAQNPGGRSRILLVCDHAGRAIPRRLGTLGLGPEDLERHIAWDIGAGALALALGERLDACVVRQAYSRLVIDCNRPLDDPTLVPEASDGTPIPGNRGLATEQLQARVTEIHAPYHAAIAGLMGARAAPLLVSAHSFTPRMDGLDRPWHVGVLHHGASPASLRMLELLRAEPGLTVGDNEPYALGEHDHTVPAHALAQGLDYLELEVRQDLIADAAGQARLAGLLAPLLRRAAEAV